MDNLKESLLAQLDAAIDLFQEFNQSKANPAMTFNSRQLRAAAFIMEAVASVERSTGAESVYARQTNDQAMFLTKMSILGTGYDTGMSSLMGILQVVRRAVAEDFLRSSQELIRAEVFSDFLEMAEHLQEEGYKGPAAVVAGTVLEQHLRKLGLKYNVPIETTDPTGKTYPKKAENLNADLAKQKVYGKNDQKQLTAWLGIRNSAAHGQDDEYSREQVDLLIQGIRGFLARYPA